MHVRSESLRLVGQRARDLWTGGGYMYPLLSTLARRRSQADLERRWRGGVRVRPACDNDTDQHPKLPQRQM